MNTDTKLTKNHRARWAAIGAAIAVSLGAGGIGIAKATSPAGASAYVGTEPCRLLDTRSGANHIGPHSSLGPDSKITIAASGDVGQCSGSTAIPATATGLQLNVTPIGATQSTNLRVYPGAGSPPNASNLNPTPGQPPIPNAVTVQLDNNGRFSIYNFQGNVDVAVDVVGHYTDHNHDDRYYTKGQSDSRYYTQGQVDNALAQKSDLPKVTVLPYIGEDEDNTINFTYELIRTVGDFTKESADTAIRLDWSAHHLGGADDNDFCHYQLRIDGRANDGDDALGFQSDQEGNAVSYSPVAPLSTFAIFEDLSTGNHTVEIYVRGDAPTCTLNDGNFNQQVIVTESEVAPTSALGALSAASASGSAGAANAGGQ